MARRSTVIGRAFAEIPPGTLRRFAATSPLILVLLWSWSMMWSDAPVRLLALATVCALVPIVVSTVPTRAASIATLATGLGAGLVVLATATDSSFVRLASARPAAWRELARRVDAGISGAATVPIPLPSDASGRSVAAMLILLAAMAVFLVIGLTVVTRRPLAGVVAAGIAMAYAWTLAPPDHPLAAGTAAAAASLLVLAAARPIRRIRGSAGPATTAAVGAGIVALAIACSIGVGDDAWWNWRAWSIGGTTDRGAELSVAQTYGPLVYPDKPIELLRVRASSPSPLRAVTLDHFDGAAFTAGSGNSYEIQTTGDVSLPPPRGGVRRTATVALTRTQSRWIFADGPITGLERLGTRTVRAYEDGSVSVSPVLVRGATYTVTTETPDPGPARLLDYRGTDDPTVVTTAPGNIPILVPAFGTGRLPDSAFGPLSAVSALSRRIIGDAATQYEAVNRLEGYMRRTFRYDTSVAAAPRPEDELRDFLLRTKAGYCQHFAGAMALMLRMNGIPARVAVGFNVSPVRFVRASGSYSVTDRDAHSWVEVDFGPEYGWLPFDPTPGRAASANSASVSSTAYSTASVPDAPSNLNVAPVAPVTPRPEERPTPETAPVAPAPNRSPTGWWVAIPLLVLGGAITPIALKRVRRFRRSRGDERRRILGAVRELESWMVDLGIPVDPSRTPSERAADARRSLGIDTDRIYGLAARARFAPQDPPSGSGRTAWADLTRAKRVVSRRSRIAAELRVRSLRANGERVD